jgi:23S rRNA (adenine2030-N6)-methyltransferase
MNYKHVFHAGNHTEVFKHSILCLLLIELRKKSKPFTVLDTHAGTGMYDLFSSEAQKTSEAQDGIGRVLRKNVPTAVPYLDIIRHLNPEGLRRYPGSPGIVQAFLRKDDRLIACELREDDAESLRENFKDDRRISVHHRDGYEGISAFVPPPTRRGMVYIDPPFEDRDEFERLATALTGGINKWPTGIFFAWYPIKDRSGVHSLRARYRPASLPPTLCSEFLREPPDGVRLVGSGVLLCNPPWQFETKLTTLGRELLEAFECRNGHSTIDWWIRDPA